MTERLCADCKHYSPPSWGGEREGCTALMGKVDPVYGQSIHSIDVALARAALCGWTDPKWWEPKTK